MKAQRGESRTDTNRRFRETLLRLPAGPGIHQSITSLFSAWLLFCMLFPGAAVASGNEKAMPSRPVDTSEKKQEPGGLFPSIDSNGSAYSILLGIDTSVLHQDSTQPEVIYEIARHTSKQVPNRVSARLDFAFFEGLFPGKSVTDGLAYLLDKEAAIGDDRDLTEQDIEESGPENGYLGISFFLYRAIGRFSPYLWIRGGGQPIPGDEGPERSAKYAVSARCGIPFKVTPACALSIDAGYVLGLAQDPAETVDIPSLTVSLEVAF